jgi:hypothetical protein
MATGCQPAAGFRLLSRAPTCAGPLCALRWARHRSADRRAQKTVHHPALQAQLFAPRMQRRPADFRVQDGPLRTDKGAMDCTSFPPLSDADHLLLAPHVLRALEAGRLPMHAADYREITTWASRTLKQRDTEVLRYLCATDRGPLRDVVENMLHERGVAAWSADNEALLRAAPVWHALRSRLCAPAPGG